MKAVGLYLRHLEEPLRNDVARLFQISRLWVRNIGNRHHTKRQIQRIIRRIIPRLARLPPCLLLRYQAAKRPDRHRAELGQDVSVVFAAEFATQLAGSGWQTRNLIRGVKAGLPQVSSGGFAVGAFSFSPHG